MVRWLILFSLFSAALYALSDTALLKRADSLVHSSAKSKIFRAYNDYKTLYLRALTEEKLSLQKKALRGIVTTGKKLHIDVVKYERELKHLSKSKKKIKPTKKVIKKTKLKVNSSHKLNKIYWKGERLVLEFDKKLNNKQINYFKLYDKKTKRYKYVFDIHASMLIRSKKLYRRGIEKIRLAQFNPKTLRLVFQNSKKLSIRFKKENNKLLILPKSDSLSSAHAVKKVKTPLYHNNKIIVIDPGHGGKDPGATGYRGLREKDVVLKIAKELRRILQKRGFKVYMTRSNDKFIKLRHRTQYANKKGADLFVSIHANAVSKSQARKVQGIESYFLSKSRSARAKRIAAVENSADLEDMNYYGKESFLNTLNYHNIIASNKLAIDLQRGVLSVLNKSYRNVNDAGVREGPFWVLVGAQMPAVLVEVGFITNPSEAKRLKSSRYQKKLAEGIANGIERYFLNN